MPNNENIDILITALKSGQYKKGRGALHITEGKEDRTITIIDAIYDTSVCSHCCLGVGECIMPPDLRGDQSDTNEDFSSLRVEAVRDWLGLENAQICNIMHVNDNNDTFEPVVELLEKIKQS